VASIIYEQSTDTYKVTMCTKGRDSHTLRLDEKQVRTLYDAIGDLLTGYERPKMPASKLDAVDFRESRMKALERRMMGLEDKVVRLEQEGVSW
jgi:hypothetical protein